MPRLRRQRSRLIQRGQPIRREGAARKPGKARRASPGSLGRLSDSEKRLLQKQVGEGWGLAELRSSYSVQQLFMEIIHGNFS
jgi:hypothetical protein